MKSKCVAYQVSGALERSDQGEDVRVPQLVEEVHLRDGAHADVAFPCPDMNSK